jgi:hypothetical protein
MMKKSEKILSLTSWWTDKGIHLATGGTDNRLVLHRL